MEQAYKHDPRDDIEPQPPARGRKPEPAYEHHPIDDIDPPPPTPARQFTEIAQVWAEWLNGYPVPDPNGNPIPQKDALAIRAAVFVYLVRPQLIDKPRARTLAKMFALKPRTLISLRDALRRASLAASRRPPR